MYNYLFSSWGKTLTIIFSWISECKFIITLNSPNDFISSTGCMRDGFISILSLFSKILEISVGLTDPYNSLFSVLSFLISITLFFIFSWIDFACFFFSWSFLFKSCLIALLLLYLFLKQIRLSFLILNNFWQTLFLHQLFHQLIQSF